MNESYAHTVMSFALFEGYTVHGATRLLEQGAIRTLPKGQALFREGASSDAVFLVLSGRLEAFVEREGGAIQVNQMPPGTLVGELGVLCGHPRSAAVRALDETVLLRWDERAFFDLMMQNFSLFRRVFARSLDMLVEREKALIEQLVHAGPRTAPGQG